MKRLSLQWRITLLTALLIACACVCMNLLLYRTGVTGMDALNSRFSSAIPCRQPAHTHRLQDQYTLPRP